MDRQQLLDLLRDVLVVADKAVWCLPRKDIGEYHRLARIAEGEIASGAADAEAVADEGNARYALRTPL